MTFIDNRIGTPHFWFEQTGADGERVDVLIVRATFDFAFNGGVVERAAHQSPVVFADLYDGPVQESPLRAIVRQDGDLVPYKPGTDILVTGHAFAPQNMPQTHWIGSVRVGNVEKRLSFYGPREMKRRFLGWSMSSPRPIDRIPLDYRLAYGGILDVPAALQTDGEEESLAYRENPAGRGWLPSDSLCERLRPPLRDYVAAHLKRLKSVAAPQIESVTVPVLNPFDDCGAHGFGPIARWCEPRAAFQGTYDENWFRSRYPLFPDDFDSRYFQSAHPDLVSTPHLSGNEIVLLDGVLPTVAEMRLPGWKIIAVVERQSGELTVSVPLLDTVRIDCDLRQVSLIWRANFSTADPAREITLGATRG